MGKPLRDLSNQKFGRWSVLSRAERPKNSSQTGAYWLCVCDCGTRRVKRGADLVRVGGSCGCLKSEKNSKSMKQMQLQKYGTVEERFFNRFKKDHSGCWLWVSHCDKDGYGILPATGAAVRAHRLSYEIHKGPIPHGMVICHSCDNPSCVNPDHLFSGTTKDNCQDMLSKGRDKMVGSRNNKAKLTEVQVTEIRSSGRSKYELAETYSVSVSTIKQIRRNKSWRHVK
ncbi:hypothetical protein NVP1191O_63 [Vibrio phage 1.191.O._10N.286.52.B4]|nr:hypothetical protein NVP1191O_63 [Vibrio phage 1.191.O._10N.286.52.B4]